VIQQKRLPILLNSVAQIFFMNRPILGGAFLLTIVFYSPFQALTCLLGAAAANSTASLLKWNRIKAQEGLYGYNAALLGLALPVFLGINWFFWIALLIGSCLTTPFCEFLSKRKVFPLTIPYVIFTWLFLLLPWGIHPPLSNRLIHSFWLVPWLGIGQVFFVESAIGGAFLLAAIAWTSRSEAVWIFIGSTVGLIPLAYLHNYDPGFSGLISLNTTLCVIAFLKLKPDVNRSVILLFTVFAAGLYPIISAALTFLSLPTLTFPFNVVMLIGVNLHSFLLKRKKMGFFQLHSFFE
jgi:urea transporter